jgi:2-hydroxycyclohexanecarboxyl-CoA dehydrogenase
VCPAPTDTPLLRSIIEGEHSGSNIVAMTMAVPMRRVGAPEDVSPAVVFFACEGAGFVTGQTLSASAGLNMSG